MIINGLYDNRFTREIGQSSNNEPIWSEIDDNDAGTEKANSNYSKKIDFTNISGDELLEWLNAGLKSGEIPHAGSSVWLVFASQNGRMNLMAKLQSAAAHARSVGHSSADSFDWMLEFVQKKQGQLFSVDVQV